MHFTKKLILLVVALCLLQPLTNAQSVDKIVWLQTAHILTMTEQTLLAGDILIQNGKIVAIAEDLSAHPLALNAEAINMAGKTITPGLILPWSRSGLVGWPLPNGSDHSTEYGAGFSSALNFAANADSLELARNEGFTSIVSVPKKPKSLFSGIASVINLDPVQPHILNDEVMLVARLFQEQNASFSVDHLYRVLQDTDRYIRNQLSIERNNNFNFDRKRLDLLNIEKVRSGQLPLFIYANHILEVKRLLDIAADLNIQLILAGNLDLTDLAEQLTANAHLVMLDAAPFNQGDSQAQVSNMLQKGVNFSFGSDDINAPIIVKLALAKALQEGHSADKLLRVLTVDAARWFGLLDRGTLAVGKVADLTIWEGPPLDTKSNVFAQMYAGEFYFPVARDIAIGMKYLEK